VGGVRAGASGKEEEEEEEELSCRRLVLLDIIKIKT
jgi:hypothetical protein